MTIIMTMVRIALADATIIMITMDITMRMKYLQAGAKKQLTNIPRMNLILS